MIRRHEEVFLAGHDSSKIARLERELAADPQNRKLRLQLANAHKRAEKSEEIFEASMRAGAFDVVNYRIERPSENYALESVADSLLTFQGSVTAVYDAVEHGPKERATYSAAVKEETRLDFAYSYPGSKGFVLTVRNEQDLLGGKLDETVKAIGEYLEINSTDDAIEASRKLGLGAISELYKWVKVNSSWGNSVDLIWKKSDFRFAGQYISADKFEFMTEVFDGAEDRDVKIIEFFGFLVGLNVKQRTFHLTEPDGESIKGKFGDGFQTEPLTIPARYLAKISQITRKTPATGKSTTSYELLDIRLA